MRAGVVIGECAEEIPVRARASLRVAETEKSLCQILSMPHSIKVTHMGTERRSHRVPNL